jgi:LPXTG-motif cell wall-anchored protein
MKRMVLSTLTMLALTTGVAFAQGPNTTPPGPTQQQEPGLTSNNLPNPGNPQTQVGNQQQQPVQEEGTVTGTATESMNNANQSNTTGPVTGTALQNEPEEGMDVDVDTGANAAGAVDVDVTRTSDADTDASGVNETGESTYGADSDSLPATGSKLPLFGLMGLLALGAAFVVRRF